jgi:hypothetical protein
MSSYEPSSRGLHLKGNFDSLQQAARKLPLRTKAIISSAVACALAVLIAAVVAATRPQGAVGEPVEICRNRRRRRRRWKSGVKTRKTMVWVLGA